MTAANRTIFEVDSTREYDFFGADNCRFKVDSTVVEAVENESDGYRSSMENLYFAAPEDFIGFPNAVDRVRIEEAPKGDTEFDGWLVRSVRDGHVWLRVGTDYSDDFYPIFRFEYQPRVDKA